MEKKWFSTSRLFVERMSKSDAVFHTKSRMYCSEMAFFTAFLVSVEKGEVIYTYFNAGCG